MTDDAAGRVRHLISLDATNLMARLRDRRPEMLRNFSRRRDRQALLGAVRSWFESARFDELAHLSPDEQSVTAAFYEQVDALRFYFRYTEDMPGTAEDVLRGHLQQLERLFTQLVTLLGPPNELVEERSDTQVTAPARGRKKKTTRKAASSRAKPKASEKSTTRKRPKKRTAARSTKPSSKKNGHGG